MSRSLFIVLAVLALILSVSAQTSTSSSSSSSSAASRSSSSSSSSSVSAPSSSSSLSSLSSLSSSSSLASSNSSTGVTGALVSNVSSSSSSSSSSSGVNVFNASSSSSSSSSYVSSSTASTTPSVPTYPVGSYAVTALGLNFSSGAANATSDNVRLDIASNVAVQNNLTANAVLPYIVITAFNTTGASSASLTTVSFVVLSNISALGVNVASVVQKLQAAGAAGQLVAPFSGASLPAQTVIVVLLGSYSSSSSTGAYTPASTYPTGSIGGSFYVTSNGSLTTAQAVPLVRSDIAYNLATLNNLTNSAQVEPYVVITNFNGAQLAPANRRLLQTATNTTVSFIILGNITNLGNAFADTTSIVQKFQAAVAAGNLSTPNLATVGAGIPAQTIYLYVPGFSSSTGGDNNGNNAASSAASATVALLFAAVASLALLL